jgi:membrane peptidoglycan carboxypeptidase
LEQRATASLHVAGSFLPPIAKALRRDSIAWREARSRLSPMRGALRRSCHWAVHSFHVALEHSCRAARDTARAGFHRLASSGRRTRRVLVYGSALCLLVPVAGCEMQRSWMQAWIFAPSASKMTFALADGPRADPGLVRGGPHDQRVGYSALPRFVEALSENGFAVTRQTRLSPELADFARSHGYALFRERDSAGLMLRDSSGKTLYRARYPERTYADFRTVPSVLVDSLLYIEDRSLLAPDRWKNPAVDWKRLALATAALVPGTVAPDLKQGGASTLATQIEKFRHYPDGVTRSVFDKFHQMMAATSRSYLDGADTTKARERIVTTYLNAVPLGARPGYGEVIGLGDGMWAWYGTDFAEANHVLSSSPSAFPARKGQLYKQALSLLIALRRPTYYLAQDHAALNELTNQYLHSLADAGVIDAGLRDAALRAELRFREDPLDPAPASFVARKATDSIRIELLRLLGVPSLYELDRLDLTVTSSLDSAAQAEVSNVLARVGEPKIVEQLGLAEAGLGGRDASRVTYSVVLHERGEGRNYVRVHADSLNGPFDINSDSKLLLGSTAKLRTLVTYLDIVSRLHERHGAAPASELRAIARKAKDPLNRWAASYLGTAKDYDLQAMLDAAMRRRYSASTGERFFTGSGLHVFHNFNAADNGRVVTIEDALVRSLNLPFIRLMRDIRDFYIAESGKADLLGKDGDPSLRLAYLQRFADQEGQLFLNRFYRELGSLSPDGMLARLAEKTGPVPSRLAVLFRAARPRASSAEFAAFLRKHTKRAGDAETVEDLYVKYGIEQFSLADRAYIANLHPLQLWLVRYLHEHPGATRAGMLEASAGVRQEAYSWLFKRRPEGQNSRIRQLLEQEAFQRIHADWRKQGYPFDALVPSLATAIGSSGDRPNALTELMGILLNDGVRFPTVAIESLHFAADTAYETEMTASPAKPERAFPPEVADAVLRALEKVVTDGTAKRLEDVYHTSAGTPLRVGGKTGTGDNRLKRFRGGAVVEARAVDRTATLVFFLGDRFYGTITAHVSGDAAAKYDFTSGLATQLLKGLAPRIQPLLDRHQGSGLLSSNAAPGQQDAEQRGAAASAAVFTPIAHRPGALRIDKPRLLAVGR